MFQQLLPVVRESLLLHRVYSHFFSHNNSLQNTSRLCMTTFSDYILAAESGKLEFFLLFSGLYKYEGKMVGGRGSTCRDPPACPRSSGRARSPWTSWSPRGSPKQKGYINFSFLFYNLWPFMLRMKFFFKNKIFYLSTTYVLTIYCKKVSYRFSPSNLFSYNRLRAFYCNNFYKGI